MGAELPYRTSAREVPSRVAIPGSVALGFSVAPRGLRLAAGAWVFAHLVSLFSRAQRVSDFVDMAYGWTAEAALLLPALLCAWRPFPGTHSHRFARLAVVAGMVSIVFEHWPGRVGEAARDCTIAFQIVTAPPYVVLGAALGRIVLVTSLAGLALSVGRRFAVSRRSAVVAAALGVTWAEVGLDALVLGRGLAARLPVYKKSLAELLVLLAFAVTYATLASAVRVRPFVEEQARREATKVRDLGALGAWRASLDAVVACAFAVVSRAGEELGFVPSLAGWGSVCSFGLTLGLLGFLVRVERARRAHPAVGSWALTVAAAFAAFCGVLPLFAVGPMRAFREVALATCGLALGGFALLLPSVRDLSTPVKKVRLALAASGGLLVLSGGGAFVRETSVSGEWLASRNMLEPDTVLLFVATLLLLRGVHLGRSLERAVRIAEVQAEDAVSAPSSSQ